MIRGFAPPWAVEVAKQVTPPTEQLRGVWLMSEPGRAKVAEEALFEEVRGTHCIARKTRPSLTSALQLYIS